MHKIAQQLVLTQSYLGELEIALEKVISEWNAEREAQVVTWRRENIQREHNCVRKQGSLGTGAMSTLWRWLLHF